MASKSHRNTLFGNRGFANLALGWAGLFAILLANGRAYPQGSTGRILGVVTDQSGGFVANARVTITDVARGVSETLTTDSDGAYVAINLLPGTYTVRAEYKGFKNFERKNILLEVGKDVRVDAVLQPGSTTETITITEEVPMVDTTSTTLGGTISNEIINDLPLNGRNYQNLISLRPGTSIYPGGGPWTQTTNGIRPEDTSYIVDGVTNDESFMGLSVTNAAAVLGDAATLLPIDAIQEFNTQSIRKRNSVGNQEPSPAWASNRAQTRYTVRHTASVAKIPLTHATTSIRRALPRLPSSWSSMEVALEGGSFLTSSSISAPLRDRCTPWAMRFPDMSRQPLRLQAAVVTVAPYLRQGTARSASRMPPLTSKLKILTSLSIRSQTICWVFIPPTLHRDRWYRSTTPM